MHDFLNKAIRVHNLSKYYRIGLKEQIHDNFFSAFFAFLLSPLRNYKKYRGLYRFDDLAANKNEPEDIIWALRDISFEVEKGEVLGIIGRNGAGKSTLLKVLSKITDPARGRVEIRGRVSSLLEVGTGFHPELTGRENVYLNGTVLGMTKKEIDVKYDQIVDFSGISKFIDTPVKRYSSGMKVRLAFSVAAHLEPEILIIDEVLAVGDAAFQRKCLNKMEDVGSRGRTVLFVSHNMQAVTRLCSRSILIDGGCLMDDGPSERVVSRYLTAGTGTSAFKEWPNAENAPGGDVARLRSVKVKDEEGNVTDSFDIRQPIYLEMKYEVFKPGFALLPHYHFFNEEGVQVFSVHDTDPEWLAKARPCGLFRSIFRIPGNLLSEGMLFANTGLLTLSPNATQFYERSVVSFSIVDNNTNDTARGPWSGSMRGAIRPLFEWQTFVEKSQ